MADPEFETGLAKWFAETPAFADADAFSRRIETRLDRSWALRRVLIGAAGTAGGVIAFGQMLGVHLYQKLESVSLASTSAISEGANAISQLRHVTAQPIGAEVLWTGAAMAVLALVLMATRSLEEF
jgi:hypothetical protein